MSFEDTFYLYTGIIQYLYLNDELPDYYLVEDYRQIKHINVNNYAQLRTAISNLNSQHIAAIINLNGDNVYNIDTPIRFENQLIYNITINGNERILDGDNQYSLMVIYGNDYNVTLNNLTIRNNYNYGYGSINNRGILQIYNSIFENNIGYFYSGIIMNHGTLFIKNTEIKNNYGHLISNIANFGNTTLIRNSIHHNHGNMGGLIWSNGTLTLEENSIKFNNANNGGAIFNNNSLSINGDSIYNNTAIHGGAIDSTGNLTILDANLTSNHASSSGGALYLSNPTYIKNTFIHDNWAPQGGAIFNTNNLTLIKNSIRNNMATVSTPDTITIGGAVYSTGNTTLTENSVKFNSAVVGAVIYTTDSTLSLNGDTIYNNTANTGAAINNQNSTITSNATIFHDNKARYGGVINNNGSYTSSHDYYYNNTAVVLGGVILNMDNTLIENSNFTQNTAKTRVNLTIDDNLTQVDGAYGGVIYNEGYIQIQASNFESNQAQTEIISNPHNTYLNIGHGGVIYNDGICQLNNNAFNNNTAEKTAGVISNKNTITATHNNFTNNKATITGGAIVNDYNANLTNNIFDNNTANNMAGAVYNMANITLNNNNFTSNLAGSGSAITTTNGKTNISHNTFKNNYAPISGGAIQINNEIDTIIEYNKFTNNNAEVGATIYADTSKIFSNNNNYTSNGYNNPIRIITTIYGQYNTSNITLIGGGIYLNKSILKNDDDYFYNNKAEIHGAGIAAFNSLVSTNNTRFTNNNNTNGMGGAIYSDNSTIYIESTKFTNNKALCGAAITHVGDTHLLVNNSNFTNNKASKTYAVLYSVKSTINIENSTFNNNPSNNTPLIGIYESKLTRIQSNLFKNSNPSIHINSSNLLLNNNLFTQGATHVLKTEAMGYYNIDNNYWGTNTPNFSQKTYNITPETIITQHNAHNYRMYLAMPTHTKNNSTTQINLIITNSSHKIITPNGTVSIQINNNESITLNQQNNTFTYTYSIPAQYINVDTITITYNDDLTSTIITANKQLNITDNAYFIVESPETAYPNEQILLKTKLINSFNNLRSDGQITAKFDNTNMGTFTKVGEKYQLTYSIPSTALGIHTIQVIFTDSENNIITQNHTINILNNKTIINVPGNNVIDDDETITITSSYDLRDYTWTTPVQSQGDSGSCWAFATTASLESSILKTQDNTYNFSENNLKNMVSSNSQLNTDLTVNTGSDLLQAASYYNSWTGPVTEDKDKYYAYSSLSLLQEKDYKVQNIVFIPNRQNTMDNTQIKSAIMKYGAVTTTTYLNDDNNNGYNDELHTPNHAVSIIGWDDNYDKNNFANTPPGDGAFLVEDSTTNTQYYYISYYDVNFAGLYSATANNGLYVNNIAFDTREDNRYDNIYQQSVLAYDGYATLDSQDLWINNTYTITANQTITAIGTYFLNQSQYQADIYKNNHKVYTQTGNINTLGYRTIPLNYHIQCNKNDEINIIVKITSNTQNTTGYILERTLSTYSQEGLSQISQNGINWTDLYYYPQFYDRYSHSASLKLYTNNTTTQEYRLNITSEIYQNNPLKIRITDDNGLNLINKELNITLDGITQTFTTDTQSTISINTANLEIGSHCIVINSFNEFNIDTTITVLNDTTTSLESDEINIDVLTDTLYLSDTNNILTHTYYDDYVNVNVGKIVLKLNGKTLKDAQNNKLYANVVNGTTNSQYYINGVTQGNHTLKIIYSHGSTQKTLNKTIRVLKQDVILGVNPVEAFIGDTLSVTANVTYSNGTTITNKPLSFKVNGVTLATQTITDGQATLNTNVPGTWKKGEYELELVVGETSTSNSIRYKTILTIYDSRNTGNVNDYSTYYPVYGETQHTNGLITINPTEVDISTSIKKVKINITTVDNLTMYYTTDGTMPTYNSGSLTENAEIYIRLQSTSGKTVNHDLHSTAQTFKPYIFKYFYVYNGLESEVFYHQITTTLHTMDNEYPSYYAQVNIMPDTDYRTPDIGYNIIETSTVQKIVLTANKLGTINYHINNNNTQTYTPHTLLTVHNGDILHTTFTDTLTTTVSEEISIDYPSYTPLVVVKPLSDLVDGQQNITFTSDDEDITIYYTRDGSDPHNTTNLRTADLTTKLTLNNLTQLKYYAEDANTHIQSEVTLYRTPKNEVIQPTITIKSEDSIDNTERLIIQTDKIYNIHITTDGTVPDENNIEYDYHEIRMHNSNTLNIALVDQNKHYYYYQYHNGELTRYTPINYTIILPNYHNITLPNVNKYNDPMDDYILEEGENGTIMLPFIRLTSININNNIYYFTDFPLNGVNDLNNNIYHISSDGTIKTTTTLNKPQTTGITIYKQDNTTVITYNDKVYNSINQFNVEYTTRPDISGEEIKLIDSINFNIDDYSTAIIETNTVPYEELSYTTTSDIGIRNQLAKQNNYNGNILTSTYAQICNNNIPTITYTKNHNNIHYNTNGEPDYNYFINNPNIYKTIVTINNKQNTRTFTLSHQDQETILKNNTLTQTQKIQQLQNMTLKYTGTLESYAIVNKKITQTDINILLNNVGGYNLSARDAYFLSALKIVEMYDSHAEYKAYTYNLSWNRTSTITTSIYVNASHIITHTFTPDMGMEVQETIFSTAFTFETTISLNYYESKMLNIIRNRTGNRTIPSNIETILSKLNTNSIQVYTNNNHIIIMDPENNITLIIDTLTGIVTDITISEDGNYHGIETICLNCEFNPSDNSSTIINILSSFDVYYDDSFNLTVGGYIINALVQSYINRPPFLDCVFSGMKISKTEIYLFIMDTILHTWIIHNNMVVSDEFNNDEMFFLKNQKEYYLLDAFYESSYIFLNTIYSHLNLGGKLFGTDDVHDIHVNYGPKLKTTPVMPSLYDGYYTITLPKQPAGEVNSTNVFYNNYPPYVTIKINTNVVGFGQYDYTRAYYIDPVKGEKRNLSESEAKQYFKNSFIEDNNPFQHFLQSPLDGVDLHEFYEEYP
ncbi:MAG: hypothetical protein BZ136_09000 [Methanosphaera sp. rholeuAM74]|nr:MAG: hypothetical protein BZ136_09000 [Methanosphaera sp. rholeuAM74]